MATPPEKTLLKRKSSLRMVRKRAARVTGLHGFLSSKARNSLLKNDSSVREIPKFEDETKEEPAETVKVEPVPVKQDVPAVEDRNELVVEQHAVFTEAEPAADDMPVPPTTNDKPTEPSADDDKPMEPAADNTPSKRPVNTRNFEDDETKEELTELVKFEKVPVELDVPVERNRKGPVVDQSGVVAEEEPAADDKTAETMSIEPVEELAADDVPTETPIESRLQEEVMQDAPVEEATRLSEALPEPIKAMPLATIPLKNITYEDEKELEHTSRCASLWSKVKVSDANSSDPIVVVLCNL